MNIDFQRIWMLLDLIIKASQVGLNETAHIVAAAKDEIKDIHNTLADAKAGVKAVESAVSSPAASIESIARDAAGNIIPDSSPTLRR